VIAHPRVFCATGSRSIMWTAFLSSGRRRIRGWFGSRSFPRPYAGGGLPGEIPDELVPRSDRDDEVIDRILELLEERLRSRNARPNQPKSSRNKGGRPPYGEDAEW
jgi:hypothetical protein